MVSCSIVEKNGQQIAVPVQNGHHQFYGMIAEQLTFLLLNVYGKITGKLLVDVLDAGRTNNKLTIMRITRYRCQAHHAAASNNQKQGLAMLDHIFITVTDLPRSISFYEQALRPLGIAHVVDYDGVNGPPGHPDLKGFGKNKRVFFWLRQGQADARAAHIGFIAQSADEVRNFYAAAMAAGAKNKEAPGARLHYDPRYYAANVLDPDGYSLEAVYKSWQHPPQN